MLPVASRTGIGHSASPGENALISPLIVNMSCQLLTGGRKGHHKFPTAELPILHYCSGKFADARQILHYRSGEICGRTPDFALR